MGLLNSGGTSVESRVRITPFGLGTGEMERSELKRCRRHHLVVPSLPRPPIPRPHSLALDLGSNHLPRPYLVTLDHPLCPTPLLDPSTRHDHALDTPPSRSGTHHGRTESMSLPIIFTSTRRTRPPPLTPCHRNPRHADQHPSCPSIVALILQCF